MSEMLGSEFMRTALITGLIVGAACAYFGVHVVLRRIVFVGAALAQVSSAGVGLALLLGLNPSVTALVLTVGGVAAFSVQVRDRKHAQESLIGVGYAVASALAVLFVAKSAQGEAHLLDVLSGNILTVAPGQLWWAAGVCLVAMALHALFHKQLLFSAFDPDTAQASGFNVGFWDIFFFVLLGVVVAVAMRLAGTLLVFAYLVLPGITGLMLSRHLNGIYTIAVGAATIATVAGLYLSYTMDLPTGPAIAACSFVLLLVAWVISKFRQ
jgi:ABC-type Mn2+/Zn2+ transport system permease subunit